MKKINNILSAMLLMALPLAFIACDNDVDYSPAEKLTGAQVFFTNANPAKMDLDGESTSFEVTMGRVKTDEAITVPLSLTGGEGIFSVPASVSFAQGEAMAKIAVTFDPNALEPNVYQEITLSIDDGSFTTPYGMADYTVSVGMPETWTDRYLGDYYYTGFFGGTDPGLVLSQSDLYPDHWKIAHWGGDTDLCFTWNQETNDVVVNTQLIGYDHADYGPVSIKDVKGSFYAEEEGLFVFEVQYFVDAGNFGNAEEYFEITGKLK